MVLEMTLFINTILTFLIIKITSAFLRERGENCLLSSLIGGELTLLFPKFYDGVWAKIILIMLTSCLIIFVSFKFSSIKDFLRIWCTFLLSTFVFGGGMLAIKSLIGDFPLFVVFLISATLYLITICVLKSVQRKNLIKTFCYQVKVKDNGKEFEEEGFLDSGNMLYDSITKKPIILVSFDVFHKLYSDVKYSDVITKNIDKTSIKNGHYVKINSLSSAKSIFVFSVDELVVGEDKKFKDVMVGLSLTGFEKSFGKGVLLHSELV